MYCTVRTVFALLGFLAVAAAPTRAQVDTSADVLGDRVPVTVALVDAVEASAEAVILRRAEINPRDVILLAEDRATPPRLAAALATLVVTRRLMGDLSQEDVEIPVSPRTGQGFFRGKARLEIASLLRKLESLEPALLDGVGIARHVTVWLPRDMQMELKGTTD